MFYKGKTIAVYCGAKRYEHEVKYLSSMAVKVYLLPGYRDCGIETENIERLSSPIREIIGDQRVSAIHLNSGEEIPVDGVFCLRSAIAPAALLPELSLDGPHIAVDRRMAANIPGCYAAGDCTGAPYQIAKAVGEGNVAAHAILDDLAKMEEN